MRTTLQAWWCYCGTKNEPHSKRCTQCDRSRIERHAQVHTSERAVVYYNPATGEHRTPPRADLPMPDVYANSGFERREIFNMSQYERESGTVHEASSFSPGNEPAIAPVGVPKRDPKVIDTLAWEMAAAFSSGAFTGGEDLKECNNYTLEDK